MEIDLNVIEVSNGFFFAIDEKCFKRNVYTKDQFGTISPRAYFDYVYREGDVPYPRL